MATAGAGFSASFAAPAEVATQLGAEEPSVDDGGASDDESDPSDDGSDTSDNSDSTDDSTPDSEPDPAPSVTSQTPTESSRDHQGNRDKATDNDDNSPTDSSSEVNKARVPAASANPTLDPAETERPRIVLATRRGPSPLGWVLLAAGIAFAAAAVTFYYRTRPFGDPDPVAPIDHEVVHIADNPASVATSPDTVEMDPIDK